LVNSARLDNCVLRAGVPAQLVVFDALSHVFWGNPDLPESQEALDIQARFLARHVEGAHSAARAEARAQTGEHAR